MRGLVLAALAALAVGSLAGCHRPHADQPTPGADAQANTAAKTIADLQAADAAAQGPPPQIAPAQPPHEERKKAAEEADTPVDANEAVSMDNARD